MLFRSSIACPRRLEQQARLSMKPQRELKKQISKESLGELVVRMRCCRCWDAHMDEVSFFCFCFFWVFSGRM